MQSFCSDYSVVSTFRVNPGCLLGMNVLGKNLDPLQGRRPGNMFPSWWLSDIHESRESQYV